MARDFVTFISIPINFDQTQAPQSLGLYDQLKSVSGLFALNRLHVHLQGPITIDAQSETERRLVQLWGLFEQLRMKLEGRCILRVTLISASYGLPNDAEDWRYFHARYAREKKTVSCKWTSGVFAHVIHAF